MGCNFLHFYLLPYWYLSLFSIEFLIYYLFQSSLFGFANSVCLMDFYLILNPFVMFLLVSLKTLISTNWFLSISFSYIFTMISYKEGGICQDEVDEMRYSGWYKLNKGRYKIRKSILITQLPLIYYNWVKNTYLRISQSVYR